MRKVLQGSRRKRISRGVGSKKENPLDVRIDPSSKQSLILIAILWREVVEEVRIVLDETGEGSHA